MSDPKPTLPLAEIPPILEEDELYDLLTSKIEPDLTTTNSPRLPEKFAGETPEQAAARSARYEKAYQEYETQFAAYNASWTRQLHAYRQTAIASLERTAQ